MQLNTHYKTRVAVKLTGIRDGEAAGNAEAVAQTPESEHTA
jgi:hypothetical protein